MIVIYCLGWGSRTFFAPADNLSSWTFTGEESSPWIYESPRVRDSVSKRSWSTYDHCL
jgi:hypothetical protein